MDKQTGSHSTFNHYDEEAYVRWEHLRDVPGDTRSTPSMPKSHPELWMGAEFSS